ncbi:MAG TPA: cation:proton antiporter [Vicinamibacterales bacterium]
MLVKVLIALTVVIIVARLMGALFKRLDQPAVIGEVVGGIMLGPSLFGRIAPDAAAFVLPADAAPFLSIISQLGVILYMFLVGLELDLAVLRTKARITIAISNAGIIVPFALGVALAWAIHQDYAPPGVTLAPFTLFIGVSLSVTAFPVLARILSDHGLQRTTMGIVALTCAAIGDATAWCLLALVVGVTQASTGAAIVTILMTVVYVVLMLTAGRALMSRAVPRLDASISVGEQSLTLVLVAVLLSALATEFIGVHAIFGAFLFGAIIPHKSAIARHVRERIEDVVRVMFLPAFFAFTGLRTEIGLVQGLDDWLMCLLIIAIATAGKFGGATLAAKASGLDWLDSAALGILMNTRGLVELIVLNIGLDLGVLTPRLFTMLVLMALVTTMMTSPILMWLLRKRPWTDAATLHRESA